MSKNKARDENVLKKFKVHQEELKRGMALYKIKNKNDIRVLEHFVRRGMVQEIGDIFELTRQLTEGTLNSIKFDRELIRSFRNSASHNYGVLKDEMVYAYLIYCTSSELLKSIEDKIKELNEYNRKNKVHSM